MKTKEARVTIYLDIETIPGEEPRLDSFTAKANLVDPVKIEADLKAKKEKGWADQSFDPFKGEIFCIGMAVNNGSPFCIVGANEKEMMEQLEVEIEKYPFAIIVGHNLLEFDAFWLFIKGLKYRLPAVVMAMTNKNNLHDTMKMMDGPGWKKMTSLDKMAKNFGLDGKGEIDGSMVWGLVKEGQGDKVCKYCESDVGILRMCYLVLDDLGLSR